MKQLVEQVKQWGVDRGLDKVGHLAQARYTLKETAELLDAYADKDIDKINDAIGDILVTLIVGASNTEEVFSNFISIVMLNPELTPMSQREFKINYFDLVERGLKLEYYYENNFIDNFMWTQYVQILNSLIEMLGYANYNFKQSLSLKDCLQLAYNEIKDRKGHTDENGHFIKED